MSGPVQAVIFDLGGTLLWWPDWTEAAVDEIGEVPAIVAGWAAAVSRSAP